MQFLFCFGNIPNIFSFYCKKTYFLFLKRFFKFIFSLDDCSNLITENSDKLYLKANCDELHEDIQQLKEKLNYIEKIVNKTRMFFISKSRIHLIKKLNLAFLKFYLQI